MKLLTYRHNGDMKLGVKLPEGVLDVTAAKAALGADAPETVRGAIGGGVGALRRLAERAAGRHDLLLPEESLTLGPCVTEPQKLICVGLNYRRHADEVKMAHPTTPILFGKFGNALAASGEEIPIPAGSTQMDYEGELGIVIGRRAQGVEVADALSYVFGYCVGNDVSARDLQFRTTQWLLGKSCDKFCPIGPYLVTADEVANPDGLAIRTWVNGELRQDSNTSDMIFACAQIVAYASHYMTLEPGDVILTGTPEGVITGYPEDRRVWLKSGDEVAVEVEGLGRLVNRLN